MFNSFLLEFNNSNSERSELLKNIVLGLYEQFNCKGRNKFSSFFSRNFYLINFKKISVDLIDFQVHLLAFFDAFTDSGPIKLQLFKKTQQPLFSKILPIMSNGKIVYPLKLLMDSLKEEHGVSKYKLAKFFVACNVDGSEDFESVKRKFDRWANGSNGSLDITNWKISDQVHEKCILWFRFKEAVFLQKLVKILQADYSDEKIVQAFQFYPEIFEKMKICNTRLSSQRSLMARRLNQFSIHKIW